MQREVTVDITNLRRSPTDDLDQADPNLEFESDREFTAGGGGFDSSNGDSGGPRTSTWTAYASCRSDLPGHGGVHDPVR
jgi:hypothetical protein